MSGPLHEACNPDQSPSTAPGKVFTIERVDPNDSNLPIILSKRDELSYTHVTSRADIPPKKLEVRRVAGFYLLGLEEDFDGTSYEGIEKNPGPSDDKHVFRMGQTRKGEQITVKVPIDPLARDKNIVHMLGRSRESYVSLPVYTPDGKQADSFLLLVHPSRFKLQCYVVLVNLTALRPIGSMAIGAFAIAKESQPSGV